MAAEGSAAKVFDPGLGAQGEQARRNESQAGGPQSLAALVEKARIIDVNTRDWTVTARSELTYRPLHDVPFMVPYCNNASGEGINFMPEVGSTCWICIPSEETRYGFVLGWCMPDGEQNAYRGGRELLNMGDIYFSTRDGNFMALRRGGIVQIGSNPVCQQVFIPLRNVIQLFAENYEIHTPAGDLMWTVLREEEDPDGHKPTTFTLAAHEYSDDPIDKDPICLVKIGSHGAGNGTILTLQTLDKGGGAVQTSLQITKDGQLTWKVKKMTFTVDTGDFLMSVLAGKATFDVKQDFSLKSGAALSMEGTSSATMKSGNSSVAVTPDKATITGPIDLDEAQFPVMRWSPDITAFFDVVTAALSSPGAGNPVVAVAVTKPTQHTNAKVKV